ncbi:MAG: thioredoxin domain-containing protein, partial [Candidatus Puniceispirillaceae bacterium]
MQSDRRSFLQITGGALIGAALPFAAQAKFDISPEHAREVRFLGSEDAAVTVSEYFSMTCGHCGNFHRNTFPEIK